MLMLGWLSLGAGCADEPASAPAPSTTSGFRVVGELDYGMLPEASGMSASRIDPARLWLVNDQGNAASLIALDTKTMAASRIAVTGASNRDWEDLAGFTLDDEHWLMIGDVGDNSAVRDSVRLIFVREPEVTHARSTQPAMMVSLRYPDGPRDVESVAVDVARDSIFLLSKRTSPPVLYRLPLAVAMATAAAGQTTVLRAERLGPVTSIPPPTAMELTLFPKFGRYRNQPTAMELSRDGRHVALLTYGEAYLVGLGPDATWLEALNGELRPLSMPVLAQPETIAIADDNLLYVTSERRNAPLLSLRLAEHENRRIGTGVRFHEY